MIRRVFWSIVTFFSLKKDDLLQKEIKSIEQARKSLKEREKILKERAGIFRWLDSSEGSWFGVVDERYVKKWILGKGKQCKLCRRLASDLSSIVRVSVIQLTFPVLLSTCGAILGGLITYSLDKKALESYIIFAAAYLVISLIFVACIWWDSDKRNRLAFELMKFSNSVPGECDIPCAMHRTSCGKQAAPTPRDDSHKGQATQEG